MFVLCFINLNKACTNQRLFNNVCYMTTDRNMCSILECSLHTEYILVIFLRNTNDLLQEHIDRKKIIDFPSQTKLTDTDVKTAEISKGCQRNWCSSNRNKNEVTPLLRTTL